LLLAFYRLLPVPVILNLFQDLFQNHLGLMDSGPAAGMTKRECHFEDVTLNVFQNRFQDQSRFRNLLLAAYCLLPVFSCLLILAAGA
jgi:hypothetical protein